MPMVEYYSLTNKISELSDYLRDNFVVCVCVKPLTRGEDLKGVNRDWKDSDEQIARFPSTAQLMCPHCQGTGIVEKALLNSDGEETFEKRKLFE